MSVRFPIPNVEFQLHDLTDGEGIFALLYDHENKCVIDCEYYVNTSVSIASVRFFNSLFESGVV